MISLILSYVFIAIFYLDDSKSTHILDD